MGSTEATARTDADIARFGTSARAETPRLVETEGIAFAIDRGAIRWIRAGDTEIVRAIDYPVRDADWGTPPTHTVREDFREDGDGAVYERDFTVGDDDFDGTFRVVAKGGATPTLVASLVLVPRRAFTVNRAGFVVLHPLSGVVGEPFTAHRPDGSRDELAFPTLISPSQPAFDLAGMSLSVHGVGVDIAFEGDVFEMEDQRNWSDASFKTYCRPLSLPWPYDLAPGERIEQTITLTLTPGPAKAQKAGATTGEGRFPDITLALDEARAPLGPRADAALGSIPFAAVQVRTRPDRAGTDLRRAAQLDLPVELEIELPDAMAMTDALAAVRSACAAAGVRPQRVLALPEGYLASIQPSGPWPERTLAEAAAAAREIFPEAAITGGVLTNFTEFNRCRPAFDSDTVSFGTCAIVHAADDTSVLETLETLPGLYASARHIAGARPIRLGLSAIGMRTNPYGSAVADNPSLGRIPMAFADPRQRGLFGAAFLVGVVAAAAEAGIESLSPALGSGPLGLMAGKKSHAYPLFHVARALAHLAGASADITRRDGLVTVRAKGRAGLCGVAANLGAAPADLSGGAAVLSVATFDAAADPGWLDDAPIAEGARLDPLDVAFLFGEGETL
ncbi:hypothetical protein [Acuticoccus kandeliae]|uniref:hypothetical protein n=1 Tax=Acuticoccus kandeliae TaxID=2073160 RepID=UPI000D3E27ED|nr:hypothetical protein [Acuticoccus kandeliae]